MGSAGTERAAACETGMDDSQRGQYAEAEHFGTRRPHGSVMKARTHVRLYAAGIGRRRVHPAICLALALLACSESSQSDENDYDALDPGLDATTDIGPDGPGNEVAVLCPSLGTDVELSVALQGGTQDYTVFRIPSVAVTSDGAVTLFAEGRPSIMDPGVGGIDLVMTRSMDCGESWSPLVVLVAGAERDAHNPTSAVVDVDGSEEVWLFYNIHPATGEDEFDLPSGLDEASANVFWIRSDDSGESWGQPVELTAAIKDPTWRLASMGPGAAIQTRWGTPEAPAGRVIVPGWWTSEDGGGCFVFWTDDLGSTWETGELPATVCSESQVLELTDGRILLDTRQARDADDSPYRQLMQSDDGGATWSTPTTGLPMTKIMAGLTRFSAEREGDDMDILLHTGVAPNDRADLRIWQSFDEGQTWQDETILASGFAQYSQPVVFPDRTIGVAFEGIGTTDGPDGVPGTGLNIQFARFDVSVLGR